MAAISPPNIDSPTRSILIDSIFYFFFFFFFFFFPDSELLLAVLEF
jgi:hypothetical protein